MPGFEEDKLYKEGAWMQKEEDGMSPEMSDSLTDMGILRMDCAV